MICKKAFKYFLDAVFVVLAIFAVGKSSAAVNEVTLLDTSSAQVTHRIISQSYPAYQYFNVGPNAVTITSVTIYVAQTGISPGISVCDNGNLGNCSQFVAEAPSPSASWGYVPYTVKGSFTAAAGSTVRVNLGYGYDIVSGPGSVSGLGNDFFASSGYLYPMIVKGVVLPPPPAVTRLSPSRGAIAGGAVVTITGSNFNAASAVKFGAANASSFVVNSDTSIEAIAPAGSGTVGVTVSTVSGTSGQSADSQFSYVAAPVISSVIPSSGSVSGGRLVTVSGSGFSGATAVRFGTNNAASFVVDGDETITAVAPAGGAGTVDVIVAAPGGVSTAGANDRFTYIANDATLLDTSNAQVTHRIISQSYPAYQYFNVGPNAVTITSVTIYVAQTGISPGISVCDNGNLGNCSQFVAEAPSPSASWGYVPYTVKGSFTAAAGSTVRVNLGYGYDIVSGPGSVSGLGNDFFASSGYLYPMIVKGVVLLPPLPAVTGVSPRLGPVAGGSTVNISGNNFNAATAVRFGANHANSFVVNSDTSITAVAPAGVSGSVDITVTSDGGTSDLSVNDRFTYVAAPVVAAVSPSAGPTAGGSVVTISGSNFSAASAVKFGASNAVSFVIHSDTSITAVAPASGAGVANITVITPGGSSSPTASDRFTYVPLPLVASISPRSGPISGGTLVTLSGSNFSTASAVRFGTDNATSFVLNSDTSITAVSPAASAGLVNITVTTAGGTSAASTNDRFTYALTPVVNGVSPNSGSTVGGYTVTLSGSNFTGASSVKFGGRNATSYTVSSDSTITAVAPAGSAGEVDVTVTTGGGSSSASASDRFTYITPSAVANNVPTTEPGVSATLAVTGCGALSNVAFTTPPAGSQRFLYGVLGFNAASCPVGGTVTVVLTFSRAIPSGATLFKCTASSCSSYPASIQGNTVTYQVTDGGQGDSDGIADGNIVDPVGLSVPVSAVPTQTTETLALLTGLMALIALAIFRRQGKTRRFVDM